MSDKIYVQIGNKKIEAKGEVLENLLQAQADAQAEQSRIEAEQQAKEDLRQSAINKLAALGLSVEEAQVIIGGN